VRYIEIEKYLRRNGRKIIRRRCCNIDLELFIEVDRRVKRETGD